MPKYLQLTNDRSQRWDLPEDSDLDKIRLEVGNAIRTGSVASITVQVDNKVQTTLIVNGNVVTVCAAYETPAHRMASF